ncbi:MAG: 2-amino-4-hydroxy-6-hydroxymethyldihydropteridine diphosphokinase [Fimbriimonadaceae bacterium]|nr:2-amino-4-hydroxy-6-hydroxymethyldihydropteridine diphosphokinase [Alphaproteobacteria bacterium]
MILIAFGANLTGPFGSPTDTIRVAARFLTAERIYLQNVSSLYLTPPFGPGRQPPYVNGVGVVKTELAPSVLLNALHRIEFRCGRRRSVKWGPRTLDIDLLAYNRMVSGAGSFGARHEGIPLLLPHPEMANRAFVMRPLVELAPHWVHPAIGLSAVKLWHRLAPSREAREIRKICGPEWAEQA